MAAASIAWTLRSAALDDDRKKGRHTVNTACRVVLDTNLWSYVADSGASPDLERMIKARNLTVVMPPSTLVEVVQTPPAEPRRRIIAALTAGPRQRLPSEAQTECAELVDEVRRCRPHWLRRFPDTARVASLQGFWTKRIWREAVADSQRLHDYQRGQRPIGEHLLAVQRRQRAEVTRTSANLRPLTALQVTAPEGTPDSILRGWDGQPVEAWRVASRDIYWRQLAVVGGRAAITREDTTFADWVGAYVRLEALRADPGDFTRLWLNDVSLHSMPRNWLRWAVNLAQTQYRLTRGNAADEQHSSYLLYCDVFLSADATLIRVLQDVREDAPFTFARPNLVSGDNSVPIVERVENALNAPA